MKYTNSFYKFTQISCLRVWYIMSNNNFDLDISMWMESLLLKLIFLLRSRKHLKQNVHFTLIKFGCRTKAEKRLNVIFRTKKLPKDFLFGATLATF